ncbi:hypothetical protein GOP47_0010920 [Adiantum capillus-veneris]|uniref:Uncharacterized protein n=1 Tax=Adiantum capillus-veneris TaxID=13818 RepID=A0A9D4UVW0_ADICA|nr:hypothetical protein GOP47_0010920 [Adiantum capillus-veneris]
MMVLVDLFINIQSTMETPKPNAQPHSSSFSPRAWKPSLLFWRRLLKKGPSKSQVSKSSINVPSSQPQPPARAKLAASKQYYTRSYTNHYYYSSPNYNSDDDQVDSNMLGCYNFVTAKSQSHPCSGYATPTACDYSPDHLSHMGYGSVPYLRLRRAHTLTPARLPLYIVS